MRMFSSQSYYLQANMKSILPTIAVKGDPSLSLFDGIKQTGNSLSELYAEKNFIIVITTHSNHVVNFSNSFPENPSSYWSMFGFCSLSANFEL